MGVDAKMFVRIRGKENWLSEAEVKRLSYEICSSFNTDTFFTMNPVQGLFKEERRALEIMKPVSRDDEYFTEEAEGQHVGDVVWFQDGEPIIADDNEQFIKVHLYGRYYGKDYERGDWPTLRAVIGWLKTRIPNGSVWYGGDSSGCCAEEATNTFLNALDLHFFTHGRRPYVHYESPFKGMFMMPKDSIVAPTCPLCEVSMADVGGSRDYTFFWCDGCGAKASKHFKGETAWAKRHSDYPRFDPDGQLIQEERKPAA